MTTSITTGNISIGNKAKAASASPVAPQPPPGIGMASSSASSKTSLGFVRRAASGGDNNGGAIGLPSAHSLSPGCYSFRDALRGGSADAGSSHTATTSSSVDSSAWSGGGHNPEGGGNFDVIFRTSSRQQPDEGGGAGDAVVEEEEEEEAQSRNESSREGRLRSLRSQFGPNESLGDSLMLLLQQGGGGSRAGGVGLEVGDSPRELQALALDDDSLDERTSSSPGRAPPSSSPPFADGPIDIFRRRGYSPIIGTPTRAGGAAPKDLLDWGRSRAGSIEGLLPGEQGTPSSWGIRPSLSCPTSVFESPLFPPSSPSSPQMSRSAGGGAVTARRRCARTASGDTTATATPSGAAWGGGRPPTSRRR